MKFKALFLILFFFTLTQSTYAQFEKGTLLLGGSANTDLTLVDGSTIYQIVLSPRAGIFINDRTVLGTGILMGVITGEGTTSVVYGLTPFARYYLVNDAPLNWFAGAGLGFSGFTSDGEGQTFPSGNINLGFSLFPSPSVAFEPSISLGFVAPSDGDTRTTLGLNAAFQLFLSQTDKGQVASVSPALRRGTLIIGGSSAGVNLEFVNRGNSFNLNLAPNIGFFATDQLALGLKVNLGYTDTESNFNTTTYGFSPFARYYLGSPITRRAAFLQGEVGFQGTSVSSDFFATNSDADFRGFIGYGSNVFLTPVTAIEGIAGLDIVGDDFATVINIGVRFGVQLFLAPQTGGDDR